MDAQEGAAKFKAADALFKQGDFQGSLRLLAELDAAYPNNKNVLYPSALCLERTGQWDKAEAICDRLTQQFQDARAQGLKARIQAVRGAVPGVGDFAGLDMKGLDDFFEPTPKRAARRPVASSSNMLRYALIGAVVLLVLGAAAVGVLGVKKGWFAGPTESVESVEAKLVDLWSKVDSYSAVLDLTAKVGQGSMPMSIHGSGALDYMKKDGRMLCRIEGVASISGGPQAMDVTLLMVSDGNDMFFQMDTMGKPMVMKMKAPPTPEFTPDIGKTLFEELHKGFDVKLLPEETLDGMKAYVFQLTPKKDQAAAVPMPGIPGGFGGIRAYFTKDIIAQVKMVASDASGAPLMTLAWKDIKANAGLAPERFKYAPPAGVKVMDTSDLLKMMPMMPKR